MAGLRVPLSTLHPSCYHDRRMTQGRGGSLILSRTTLSFATPCRFCPALSLTPFHLRHKCLLGPSRATRRGSFQGLPISVQRVSTHAQGLRLRGVHGRLAVDVAHGVAFP